MPILTDAMTYEELLTYPNDGLRREIHEGELVVAPSPDWRHQRSGGRFAFEVRLHLRARGLPDNVFEAPLDLRLTPHNVYQPDVIYIGPERRHLLGDKMPIDGAPDLVAEVLSPSTRTYDQREKARVYARAGIREYWVLDPENRTIEVYELVGGEYVLVPPVAGRAVSRVLPGFSVDPNPLFADL